MQDKSIITIGNFDGVHLGHKAIIRRACELSYELSPKQRAKVIALCFDPHPVAVLRPKSQPPQICPVNKKIELLKQAGADEVVIIKPRKEILSKTPREFVKDLNDKYDPIAIVEGADFHFGKGRAGDMEVLKKLGKEYDFSAITQHSVEVVLNDKKIAAVSSSLVRWLIGRGRVEDAALCMGRNYSITAPVITGEKQGRKLGIPTANLDLNTCHDFIIPVDGVYAGYVHIENIKDGRAGVSPAILNPSDDIKNYANTKTHLAAISIGIKPTFGKKDLTIEAHLLDFSGNLYGKTISVEFIRFLRDQFSFPDLNSLKQQMAKDIECTRNYLNYG